MATSAGYSGTPLWKKLGYAAGRRVCVLNAPGDYPDLLAGAPEPLQWVQRPDAQVALLHLFVDRRAELARQLTALRKTLGPEAVLWVSWPKKASQRPTDITEDAIRADALPLGWVDVKVCAVDATWSGLKLVVRKALRAAPAPAPAPR
jgi:hypothetical protein